MKHKVSELNGALLDTAVAIAVCRQMPGFSWSPNALDGTLTSGVCLVDEVNDICAAFCPSEAWADGGPIIERERINIHHYTNSPDAFGYLGCTSEVLRGHGMEHRKMTGETALIAAMRAYVASKLGEEVELP